MADQDFGKGDKFWEVIQRKEIYESLRPLLNEVKEAMEYEDEHGMDNWGSDPGYIVGALYGIGIRVMSIAIFYLNVVTIIELSK